MHIRNIILAVTVSSLLLGIFPMLANGQMRKPNRRMERGICLENATAKLDLNSEQKEQIQAIRNKYQRDQIQIRADLQLKRVDLKEITNSENPDRASLEKKLREISDIQTKHKLLLFDQQQEIGKILSAEQMESLKEIKQKGKKGHFRRFRSLEKGCR